MTVILVWLGTGTGTGTGGWDLLDDDLGEPENPVEPGTPEGEPVVQIGVDNFFESVDDFPEGVSMV